MLGGPGACSPARAARMPSTPRRSWERRRGRVRGGARRARDEARRARDEARRSRDGRGTGALRHAGLDRQDASVSATIPRSRSQGTVEVRRGGPRHRRERTDDRWTRGSRGPRAEAAAQALPWGRRDAERRAGVGGGDAPPGRARSVEDPAAIPARPTSRGPSAQPDGCPPSRRGDLRSAAGASPSRCACPPRVSRAGRDAAVPGRASCSRPRAGRASQGGGAGRDPARSSAAVVDRVESGRRRRAPRRTSLGARRCRRSAAREPCQCVAFSAGVR